MEKTGKMTFKFKLMIYTLFIVFTAQYVYAESSALSEYLTKVFTAPTIIYEYNNMHCLQKYLENRNGPIKTELDPNGTFFPYDKDVNPDYNSRLNESFKGNSNVLIGTTFDFDFLHQSYFKGDFSVLFGFLSQEVSFYNTIHNGIGGVQGYTADVNTSISYKTNVVLNFKAYPNVDSMRFLFFSFSFKQATYSVNNSGKRWDYDSTNNTAGLARENKQAQDFSVHSSGTLGIIEPGFGISVKGDNRSQLFLGVKWPLIYKFSNSLDTSMLYFGAVFDLYKNPDNK